MQKSSFFARVSKMIYIYVGKGKNIDFIFAILLSLSKNHGIFTNIFNNS